jgi:hypothetical protein
MSKIIDTFMYNEPGELELLLAKLSSEQCDELIAWVVVENDYTFQGDYKGYSFPLLLKKEERLKPFLDKIIHVQVSIRSEASSKIVQAQGKAHMTDTYTIQKLTEAAFNVEHMQRIAAHEQICHIGNDSTSVLVSDIDEILDLSDHYKLIYLVKFLKQHNGKCMIERCKFQYDINNAWPTCEKRWLNIISVSDIRKNPSILAKARSLQLPICKYPNSAMAFEYSYVFDIDTIYRKLRSFSHVGPYNTFHIDRALLLNTKVYNIMPKYPLLFEKVELSLSNCPIYILENKHILTTNLVSRYYNSARIVAGVI